MKADRGSTHSSAKLTQLKFLSELLDTRFQGPFGTRFGVDGVLGLIPVVGDLVTTGLALYILAQAATFGCSTATLLRMGLNVALESLVDAVPVLGNLFDFYWKANVRNMQLLEKHLQNPQRVTRSSRLILVIVLLFILLVLGGSLYLAYEALSALWHWLASTKS